MSECPRYAIVRALAHSVTEKLVRRTIHSFQRMNSPDELTSGDCSELKSVWDEICVQVQYQESWAWRTHEMMLDMIIQGSIEELPPHELQAIWLETPEGEEWDCENEDERDPFYPFADHVQNYIKELVLSKASDWSNPRIRQFLYRFYEA